MNNFEFLEAKKIYKVKKSSNYHPPSLKYSTSTILGEKWLALNVINIRFSGNYLTHSIITTGYHLLSCDCYCYNHFCPLTVSGKFDIYRYDESTSYQVPYLKASTAYLQLSTQIGNLQPYIKYQFLIKECNSAGCKQHSYKVTATTKAISPHNQPPPPKVNKNSSSISLVWLNNTILNGPLPFNFIIEWMSPPFNAPPPQV